MAFKDDFIRGRALRSISAAWLNGIANALNSLSIRFDPHAVNPRIEKPPMPDDRAGWTIVLPPYPTGGGEGGGEVGNTNTLGPLEYEEVDGVARIVQYIGTWTLGADSKWVFARMTDDDNKDLPPAHVYEVNLASVMIRQTATNGAQTVAVVPFPMLFAQDAIQWLYRQTLPISTGVKYNVPGSEFSYGSLVSKETSFQFFSDVTPAAATDNTVLTTIVEDANEVTTYESASGDSGNGEA